MPLDAGSLLEQTAEQAFSYGVGGALSPLLDVATQPIRNELWRAAPTLPLDPASAALAQLRLLGHGYDGAGEAQLAGLDADRFATLLETLKAPPSTGELLELLRRGVLDMEQTRLALRQLGLADAYLDPYLSLTRTHLSPADLAMARQQEFIGDERLHEGAAMFGVTSDDADLLYEMAGLPPGVTEALELIRRGEIDEETFRRIVAEGHGKTKWTDTWLKLRYVPLSAAVAAEALIRERITQDDAVAIAAKNGVRADDFLLWSNMMGRPPGPETALRAVNRGLVGDPQSADAKAFFREVVARSDVRTEYADVLYELRVAYPSLYQIVRALSNGAIDDQTAHDTLRKEGYPEEWAGALVKSAHATRTGAHKELALSVVQTLYQAGIYTHAQADAAITHLGYTPEEANDLLEVLEARHIASELAHGTTVVRGRYTSWRIDATEAGADLVALGLDAATRDRLLGYWRAERDANAPVLTTAQIAAAFKWRRYTFVEAQQALLRLGWTIDDALTVLWNEVHGDPRDTAPQPGVAVTSPSALTG